MAVGAPLIRSRLTLTPSSILLIVRNSSRPRLKEFTATGMEASKKILEEKKAFAAKNKGKPPYVSTDKEGIMEMDADVNNDFLMVPQ